MGLFSKNKGKALILNLNAKFQPIDRFDLEDALDELLKKAGKGEVTGGGTTQEASGEIKNCDIEIWLKDASRENVAWLIKLINAMGVPKGSSLIGDGVSAAVGKQEGLACYLNGRDLPMEVYKSGDINKVIEKLEKAMEGIGMMYSYWEGPKYTALYFYGTSYTLMKRSIEPILARDPMCQKCIIKQIA